VSRRAARTNLLDATALVKLVVMEERSEKIRRYLETESSWYTTPFCFYEALSVLKRRWMFDKEISEQEYSDASFRLIAEYRGTPKVYGLDLTEPVIFISIREIVTTDRLDISDAFQIVSIIKGCPFAGDSRTILITDDKKLAQAARRPRQPTISRSYSGHWCSVAHGIGLFVKRLRWPPAPGSGPARAATGCAGRGARHEPDSPLLQTLDAAILASQTTGIRRMSAKAADLRRR
jgi:predicted nucleic acid-binding protein